MLIYFNYANLSQVLWVFHDTFFSWKAHFVHFQISIIDHTTVNTFRDILLNMRCGQFCLYLLYRDELKRVYDLRVYQGIMMPINYQAGYKVLKNNA